MSPFRLLWWWGFSICAFFSRCRGQSRHNSLSARWSAGVVVIELLTSFYQEAEAARSGLCRLNGPCGDLYSVMVAGEEALEMLNITIFADALLKILESTRTLLRLKFIQ